MTEEQLSGRQKQKESNKKALQQGLRLGNFFKLPFQETSPFGWKTALPNKLTVLEAQEKMQKLIDDIRSEGIANDDIRRIIERCEKYKDSLFTYLTQNDMPPDNNAAERNLRHFAVQRRISGGFKSPTVMGHYAVYLSLYMTCKANIKEFETILTRVLSKDAVNLRQFLFS